MKNNLDKIAGISIMFQLDMESFMKNQEEYYIFYNGIGNAVIASKQNKDFIDSIYNKHTEDVYPFNEETRNMLIEKKVTIADTLYKTDSIIYKDFKEMQKIVDNFNSS